jgi:hypothetical protein
MSSLNRLPLPDLPERSLRAPEGVSRAENGRLAPGFAAKLNLLVDLLLVMGALLGSTVLMGHSLQLGHLDLWLMLGVAGLGWLLVGSALCLDDPRLSDRAPMDDLALVSILVDERAGLAAAGVPQAGGARGPPGRGAHPRRGRHEPADG